LFWEEDNDHKSQVFPGVLLVLVVPEAPEVHQRLYLLDHLVALEDQRLLVFHLFLAVLEDPEVLGVLVVPVVLAELHSKSCQVHRSALCLQVHRANRAVLADPVVQVDPADRLDPMGLDLLEDLAGL